MNQRKLVMTGLGIAAAAAIYFIVQHFVEGYFNRAPNLTITASAETSGGSGGIGEQHV